MIKIVLALLFIAGVVLTGQDGEWFPIANIFGLICLYFFSIAASSLIRRKAFNGIENNNY